ncbi:hypothetical protein BD311DRAFT_467531 [Dichomitus squalens]|uniref:Uncharacterized protein n=1 Tax=Dichomitus squalens TaxID=114155 RepID=A0A4Q9MJ29_9APHY|nr:hypothetical protein BD311DRAFT_467531 [Dichomitus squalens]
MLSLHRSRRFLCITTVIPLVLLLTSLGIWTRSLTIWLAPALVRFRRKPQAVADCVRLSGLRFRSMLVAHAFQSAPTFPSTIAVVYPRHDAVHTRLLRPPRRSHTLPPMSSPTVSSAPSSDSSPLVPSARSSAALGPTSRPSISVISTSEGLLRLHRASASLLHRLPATSRRTHNFDIRSFPSSCQRLRMRAVHPPDYASTHSSSPQPFPQPPPHGLATSIPLTCFCSSCMSLAFMYVSHYAPCSLVGHPLAFISLWPTPGLSVRHLLATFSH